MWKSSPKFLKACCYLALFNLYKSDWKGGISTHCLKNRWMSSDPVYSRNDYFTMLSLQDNSLSKTWKFSVYFKFHEIPCKICVIRQKPWKIYFSTLCSHSFRDFTVKIFFLGIRKNWDKIKIWYVLRTLHRTKYVVL